MSKRFPIRAESHKLEEASERFFRNALPRDWTCEKPEHDYGVDLRVDIFEDGQATGLELLVQLKSSAESSGDVFEIVRVKTSTYNYLWSKLQVVILVKFVEADSEGYWLWLRDIVEPREDQETLNLKIPKTNRLSRIDWEQIKTYVRRVTDVKTAAMRREALS
jgi:uncharacterized protein DUF4365